MFPENPTNNQKYVVNGTTYIFNLTNTAWAKESVTPLPVQVEAQIDYGIVAILETYNAASVFNVGVSNIVDSKGPAIIPNNIHSSVKRNGAGGEFNDATIDLVPSKPLKVYNSKYANIRTIAVSPLEFIFSKSIQI